MNVCFHSNGTESLTRKKLVNRHIENGYYFYIAHFWKHELLTLTNSKVQSHSSESNRRSDNRHAARPLQDLEDHYPTYSKSEECTRYFHVSFI